MRCERCGKDPETIVLLPIKQPDGRYSTFACVECSLVSGYYCEKHSSPHLGFEDGSSACIKCIEEQVKSDGEKVAAEFAVRSSGARNFKEIREVVGEYLEGLEFGLANIELADIPLASMVADTSNAQNIARPIVTYSLRKKITIEQAIQQSVEKPHVVFLGYNEQDL